MNPKVGMVRLVLGSLGVSLLTTFFLMAPAAAADQSREVVLLRSPALVKAVFTEGVGPWSFEIQIGYAGQTESVSTTLVAATYPDAVRHLRKAVAWRKPYLFVVSECGGGNIWSCDIEHVLRIEGKRFAKLGEFVVEGETSAATSYDHNYFLDLYDKLEDSASLSHAASPRFQIVLRDRDGQLALDLEETWRMNRDKVEDLFGRWIPEWAVTPQEILPEGPRDEERGSITANALAIALYCGKRDIARKIVAKTSPLLIREDLDVLDKVQKQVRPGELPSRWRGDDRSVNPPP